MSPGQDGDGPHGRELLREFERGEMECVLGDTAYDGDEPHAVIKHLKAKACIKPSKHCKTRKRYDKEHYKNRNQVERFFNRIKRSRRVATRYEKTIENSIR